MTRSSRSSRSRAAAGVLGAVLVGGSLTGCTASTGGYVAVARDQASGDVVLVVRLCEPTRKLDLELKRSVADGPSEVVWSAKGAAHGRDAVVRVGRPPAGWTTEVDEPVPASAELRVTGWSERAADDGGVEPRVTGPSFTVDALPVTSAAAPTAVVYEDHEQTRRATVARFTSAADRLCSG